MLNNREDALWAADRRRYFALVCHFMLQSSSFSEHLDRIELSQPDMRIAHGWPARSALFRLACRDLCCTAQTEAIALERRTSRPSFKKEGLMTSIKSITESSPPGGVTAKRFASSPRSATASWPTSAFAAATSTSSSPTRSPPNEVRGVRFPSLRRSPRRRSSPTLCNARRSSPGGRSHVRAHAVDGRRRGFATSRAMQPIHVIGGGLAGCEAAWQIARARRSRRPARNAPRARDRGASHRAPRRARLLQFLPLRRRRDQRRRRPPPRDAGARLADHAGGRRASGAGRRRAGGRPRRLLRRGRSGDRSPSR